MWGQCWPHATALYRKIMLSPCVSCSFLDGFEVPWLQFYSMFGCYLRESNGETLADPQACSLSFSLVGLPYSPCTISCFHPPFLNHFKVHQPTYVPTKPLQPEDLWTLILSHIQFGFNPQLFRLVGSLVSRKLKLRDITKKKWGSDWRGLQRSSLADT